MAKIKGVNSANLKKQNRISILKTLKNYGSISRKDLSEHIKLTAAAVTIITNEMIAEGILREIGVEQEEIRVGRKKILLDINEAYKYIVAININKYQVEIGVYNIKGKIQARVTMLMDKSLNPKDFIKQVSTRCMKLLWENNLTKEQVLGIGVSIIGIVDKEKGISKKAYGIWKEEVELKKMFEDNLGVPVVIENNARALAMAELEMSDNNIAKDMLFIKYGPGIGSVLVLNQQIHYGNRSLAGEIGHITIEANGKECRCGKKGCLETVASEEALMMEIKEIFSQEKTPILYELCNGDYKLFNAKIIEKKSPLLDENVNEIIKKAIFNISLVISNIITFVDISKVVIYGKIFDNNELFDEVKNQIYLLKNDNKDNLIIEKSLLNERDSLYGTYIVAVKELFYEKGGSENERE